jgi:hypothetical protein
VIEARERLIPGLDGRWVVAIAISIALLVAQLIVLGGHVKPVHPPDADSYTSYARHLKHGYLTDTFRTFGYPSLLAILGERATEWLQIAAVCVVPFVVAALVHRATSRFVLAGAAGVIAALDVYAIQWERAIGTEALGYASLTIWALLLARILEGRRGVLPAAIGAAWLVVLRPIFLPVVLAAIVVVVFRARRQALALLAATLVPVIGLTIANGVVHHKWTMTTVATGNVPGKVFRYGMQSRSVPRRYERVRAAALKVNWDGTGESFLRTDRSISEDRWNAWAASVVAHHPFEYIAQSADELVQTWLLLPTKYTNWTPNGLTLFVAGLVWSAYLLLPFAVLIAIQTRDHLLAALAVMVTMPFLVMAVDEYIDFERVRMPVQALVIATAAYAIDRTLALWAARHETLDEDPAT